MKNHIILLLFFSLIARYSMAQCDPNCGPTDQLIFNTGWDPATGSTISIGQTDPHWRLMNVPPISGAIPPGAANPTPPDAYAITPFQSGWNVLPNSRVLSMTDQSNFGPNNLNTTQPWRFRRYFCLCQDAEVVLDGRIKADDTGKLSLYDGSGAPTSFSISLPPAPNTGNFNTGVPFSQALFLTAGTYYFEFELLNTNGVATGFAVEGNMTSANGPVINDEQSSCCAVSVITGQKILDLNSNGVYDPATDQTGAGFFFDLIDNTTGMIIATAQSDGFGEFEFNNLPPGSYTVRERPQWGWLPGAAAFQINLGTNDAQHVTFLNLPYTPTAWLDCTYGGIQPNPANTANERGLAITTDGGFFGANITRTFTATDLSVPGFNANDKLVSKSWDNASGALLAGANINSFTDVDAGTHFVDKLHVLNRSAFCDPMSRYAAVGTVRNGNNTDVFYTEFATDGSMRNYADVTSTPGFERESVSDFIELSSNELMWVGTKITAPPSTRRVMVSKFDACSPTTFSHREYEIQTPTGIQNANGNSIIELTTPLNGQPNAKYAVTGQVGNEVFLLFLGANLNQVGTSLTYDVDSDASTIDAGVRIRRNGDYLYIVGNQTNSGTVNFPSNIFLLKLGFLGQQGIPQASTKIYDFQGGGTQVIDMEINGFDELILTGVCDLPAIGGGFQSQQTFLMGLDEFGNQLWGKKVAFSEGSEPADLKLSQLFDEINITGSCWVNELTGNPFLFYIRRFDEMTIRASRFGELTYNTTCTAPLLATVTAPMPRPQDFIANSSLPGYTFSLGTQANQDYFVARVDCTVGGSADVICDSLMLMAQQLPDTSGNCCFSINYQNNSPAPVYALCIRIGGGSSGSFSNIGSDPSLTATLAAGGQEINIRSSTATALPAGTINDAVTFCLSGATSATLNYLWKDAAGNVICEQAEVVECSTCTADFTWTSDCCELQLMGSATGTGPYTYEWDFLCDGTVDATGPTVTLSNLPVGPNVLCLKITDATGCMATVQQTVIVVGDNTPPVINCPSDITLPTDPGECFATYSIPPLTATDDCDDDLMVSCFLTGATTTPIAPVNALPKGITVVNCAVEDDKGNLATCTYNITVVDTEPPLIECPDAISVTVPACAGGSVVNFSPPMFSDNCPMVTYTCSHQSGDFFPCGTTIVTCIATDMAGNQTSCSFPVTVDCACAEVGPGTIECTDVDDQFFFSVQVNDLTGSGPNGCTISVSSPQSGVTISGVTTTGTGPGYTITGLIDVAAPPMPNSISIVVSVSCTCPDGTVHDCTFTRTLTTPCCKEIAVAPQEVCKTDGTVQIPLIGCNNLYDVQQVRWYIADAPCPPASWGAPFQVTNGCSPLNLSPQYHTVDICVYAEVDMGPDAGPCRTLATAPVTITLCEPAACTMMGNQEHCYSGSPVTPSLLTISVATPCAYTIEWYDYNGNLIPGATGTTYQPPALSFTGAPDDCYQDFTYTALITGGVCPDQSCSATIRLYNDDAPLGSLVLLPPDVNPLCYGEDAILEYTPACAGEPERWNWSIRPDVVPTYTPLISNGDRNPLYYTNRLYEDTWVKVEKTNGVCPTDEIEIFLDIIDPITIQDFTAMYDDPCAPTAVDLMVDFKPQSAPAGCLYTITWYRNGQVIGSSTSTTPPVNFTYVPPAGAPLHGNYYVVVDSDCCPGAVRSQVVTLEPPMEVEVAGPCFRCNCDDITLDGIVRYPIAGFNCTYQWYDNGLPIPGETQASLNVDPSWDGPFTFEVTCTDGTTTCVQSATYMLLQCGDKSACLPAVCEDNLVQNGDFEQGTAGTGDEDINNAANWGGIWSNAGTTFSSADFYSDVTGVPSSLQAPLPTAQGQFAGFWSRIQGGDEFREGVLNELNTTIMPNTGVYELTFKLACLFTPTAPASLSVFVANGGINGGAALTSGTAPLNSALFADSWEIVVHPITTACDNNFQLYTYTMDTADPAFPSSGVNAIFFTRTDGVQPGAYVALDDVCLRSACCQDETVFMDAVQNGLTISQSGSTATLSNASLNSCSQLTIDWGDGSQSVEWATPGASISHTYGASGTYAIQVTVEERDSQGSICFDAVVSNTLTGTRDAGLEAGLRLYPNPTWQEVYLEWESPSTFARYTLRDASGAMLRTLAIQPGANSLTLDLADLPSGLYFVQLFTDQGRQVARKVVKQ